ncbi:MAG: hypothetical protein ACLP56_07130, partial [Candidatus Sulfotelmatobacter sp.]
RIETRLATFRLGENILFMGPPLAAERSGAFDPATEPAMMLFLDIASRGACFAQCEKCADFSIRIGKRESIAPRPARTASVPRAPIIDG